MLNNHSYYYCSISTAQSIILSVVHFSHVFLQWEQLFIYLFICLSLYLICIFIFVILNLLSMYINLILRNKTNKSQKWLLQISLINTYKQKWSTSTKNLLTHPVGMTAQAFSQAQNELKINQKTFQSYSYFINFIILTLLISWNIRRNRWALKCTCTPPPSQQSTSGWHLRCRTQFPVLWALVQLPRQCFLHIRKF